MYIWEFGFRIKIYKVSWQDVPEIVNIIGGTDACGLDAENGCFQTRDTLQVSCLMSCTEVANRMAKDATFEDNDHRKQQNLNVL